MKLCFLPSFTLGNPDQKTAIRVFGNCILLFFIIYLIKVSIKENYLLFGFGDKS